MVIIFEGVGLQTNLRKTKAVVYTPGLIWGQQGVEAYRRRATGEGPTFREMKITRVSCEECGGTMGDYSLQRHIERSHGIVLPQVRGVDVREGGPEIHRVSLPRILKLMECPVEGCPERAKTPGILMYHFM